MVVHDAGPHTRQVTLDYFFDNVLPPLHKKIDLPTVIKKLKKNETIQNGRLAKFPRDPKDTPGSEPDVFRPLGNIAQEIVNAAKRSKGMPIRLYFYNAGSIVPTSRRRTCHSKPDFLGSLKPYDENHTPEWVDTMMTAELKLEDTDGTANKASGHAYPC